jgi:hypothetical protein
MVSAASHSGHPLHRKAEPLATTRVVINLYDLRNRYLVKVDIGITSAP